MEYFAGFLTKRYSAGSRVLIPASLARLRRFALNGATIRCQLLAA